MTAPERIWAYVGHIGQYSVGDWSSQQNDWDTEYVRADLCTPTAEVLALVEALQAIIARWDTPAWKDAEPTGAVIDRARAAVAAWERGRG